MNSTIQLEWLLLTLIQLNSFSWVWVLRSSGLLLFFFLSKTLSVLMIPFRRHLGLNPWCELWTIVQDVLVSIPAESTLIPFASLTCCASGVGTFLGPILVGGGHLTSIWVWMYFRQQEAIECHCGYDLPFHLNKIFPFYCGAFHHDYHHCFYKQNYASVFTWCDRYVDTVELQIFFLMFSFSMDALFSPFLFSVFGLCIHV